MKYERGDKVLYKGRECKIQQSIPVGKKWYVIDDNGKQRLVDSSEISPVEKEKSLTELVTEAKREAENKEKEGVVKPAPKEKRHHPDLNKFHASFSVITRDYVNGKANGYESKETIVHGKTKDGVRFTASVYGDQELSKAEITKIADRTVLDADLTTSKQDKAFSTDRIQEMLNDNSDNYVVYTNGTYVTASEINDNQTLEDAENLEDFGDFEPEHNSDWNDLIKSAKEEAGIEESGNYTSPYYDDPEEELDDIMSLSGVSDITEL